MSTKPHNLDTSTGGSVDSDSWDPKRPFRLPLLPPTVELETKPVLKELQAFRKKWASLKKQIAKLKKSARRGSEKKLKKKLAERDALEKKYEALREKLLK